MQIDWASMLADSAHAAPNDAANDVCNRTCTGYRVQKPVTKNDSQGTDLNRNKNYVTDVTAVTATFQRQRATALGDRRRTPGGGDLCSLAPAKKAAIHRPVLDYGLTDQINNGGRMIGAPGDAPTDLMIDLQERYGARLNWVIVRGEIGEPVSTNGGPVDAPTVLGSSRGGPGHG